MIPSLVYGYSRWRFYVIIYCVILDYWSLMDYDELSGEVLDHDVKYWSIFNKYD